MKRWWICSGRRRRWRRSERRAVIAHLDMKLAPFRQRVSANLAHDCGFVKKYWLALATATILAFASAVWIAIDGRSASEFATYVAGFAGALAFLWLTAGYKLQANELALQRQELQLQRLATQQQAKELSNSARLASLSQIHNLVQEAEAEISKSELNLKMTELPTRYMSGIKYWKVLEESSRPHEVINAASDWLPIEGLARNYIRRIAAAMILYIEHHHPDHPIDRSKSEEEFVYLYNSWVTKAPYLSHHIGLAALLAQFMVMLKPGSDRALLAMTVAHAKSVGAEMFNSKELEEMRDKVLARSDTLPAICTPWPTAE